MLNRTEKHENKEQSKIWHETPRSKNHKSTENKKNTRAAALERSVEKLTGGLKHFNCRQIFTLTAGNVIRGSQKLCKGNRYVNIRPRLNDIGKM